MPDRILANVPGMQDADAAPVLEAGDLTEEAFNRDYVANSRPCVIRGAVRHWPALQKWRDKDYLKRTCGPYDVSLVKSELHVTRKRMMQSRAKVVTFGEAIDFLHADQTERGAILTDGYLSEFLPDLGGVSFLSKAEPSYWYPAARFFFYRDAGSAWHNHPFDENLMCQIIGAKKIGLVNTDHPFNAPLRNFFFREDYYDDPGAFTGFDAASLPWLTATLQEGDALYIPPLWWHGVITLTTAFGATAAVTWRSPPNVIAKAITKMARGEVDVIGKTSAANLPGLIEVARRLGLERELAAALARGI